MKDVIIHIHQKENDGIVTNGIEEGKEFNLSIGNGLFRHYYCSNSYTYLFDNDLIQFNGTEINEYDSGTIHEMINEI